MGSAEGHAGIVALAELKAFLRIETDMEDALLAGLLRSAESIIESWIGQLLVRREIVEEGHAEDGTLRLSRGPVQAVLAVAVADAEGMFVELPPSGWVVQSAAGGRARIRLQGTQEHALARVRVRYRAGLSDGWNGVPEPLRQAVIRAAAHGFAHRDSPDDAGLPPIVRQLVEPWRNLRMI
jgi:uncharacterized phiE125 gp8 family phage protein